MTAALDLLDVPAYVLESEIIDRLGLAAFVQRAWHYVERSAQLQWSWHLDAICEHLEAIRTRAIRDLVINVPPGCSKSLLVSVLWPAFVWSNDPGHRFIAISYSDKVVNRDAERMRALIKTRWYGQRWPQVEIPQGKAQSDAVSVFRTTAGGMRYSVTIRGQVTGEHADTMVIDDPIDPLGAEAASGVELETVLRWWNGTASTRFRDPARSARVLIMQRLHERDLSAEMARAGATVLCLPMRFERAHPQVYAHDKRSRDGELLVPGRMPETAVRKIEQALGPYRTAAQLQQRPAPAAGGIFKQEWLEHYWTELPLDGFFIQSWDLAFKDLDTSSYVVGQVWYSHDANFYLVDQRREHMDFEATTRAIKAMSGAWVKSHNKLIEDKANGPAVASALKREVPGIELVNPEGGKIARAHAVQGLFAAGNVFLPHPDNAQYPDGRRGAPWIPEYQHELKSFPNGLHDDQVDATTQALNYLAPRLSFRMQQAIESLDL